MDLHTNFLVTALLLHFLIYTDIAQGDLNNQVQCKLLPTQTDISSEFRQKASEKGVRLVFLNLKIGNDSYHPLELQDEFLPDRWVWANNITEPMLPLSDDYDILSLGLLNYNVRSMDVHLEDQPSGCLANLNSTGQNMAVGRMLLENVTTESSVNQLSRKSEVVCVTMIEPVYDGNEVHRRCCGVNQQTDQQKGPSEIECDLTVEKLSNYWMDMLNSILLVVSVVMAYYLPAVPLALPDCIFSLQYECDKEDRGEAEQTDSDESVIRRRNGFEQINTACREEEVTSKLSHCKEEETRASEIPVDDSTPVTIWALLRAYIQKLPDSRLSFNIKLAVMLFFIFPCVLYPVYLQTGLWLTLKKKYIHESFKKKVPLPGHSAPSLDSSSVVVYILPALAGLALVLFLRPKNLLFRHDMCFLCRLIGTFLTIALPIVDLPRKRPDSIGNEILCHLRMVRRLPAFVWSTLTELHMRLLEKLLSFSNCSSCCNCSLSMVNHHESTLKRAMCVFYVLFSTLVTLPVALFGAICLGLLLLIVVLFLLYLLSPCTTLGLLFINAMTSRNCCIVNSNVGRSMMIIFFLIIFFLLGIPLVILLSNSAVIVMQTLQFITIGLYLNADIVTPYLAFFLAVATNIYLCYANLQDRYREFKGLILKYWQKKRNISSVDQDTIPRSLFWFVSDRGLPIAIETCRMFCNIALIVTFLSLFLTAVLFFKDTYSISAGISTVSVFVSGVIPRLFFKGITKGKVFIGWEKIKLKREIEIAVEEFDRLRDAFSSASGGIESSETNCDDQV